MFAALFSGATKNPTSSRNQGDGGFDQSQLNNMAMSGNPSNVGIATKWVNPYVYTRKVLTRNK